MDRSDQEKKQKKKKKKRSLENVKEVVEPICETPKKKKKYSPIVCENDINLKSESPFKSPAAGEISPKKKKKHLLEVKGSEEHTLNMLKTKKKLANIDTDSSICESPPKLGSRSPEKSKKKKKFATEEKGMGEIAKSKKEVDYSSDDSTFVSIKSPKSKNTFQVTSVSKPLKEQQSSKEKVKPKLEEDYNFESEMFMGWKKEELQHLFNAMKEQVPNEDAMTYSSRLTKLDWSKVAFENKTADECKTTWMAVQERMRKFRFLSEILDDAYIWADTPWTSMRPGKKALRHPEMPKKPATAFFLFFHAKAPKYKRKHPEFNMIQMSKFMGEKYKALPEERKAKYTEKAKQLKLEYSENLKQFLQDHPSVAASLKKVGVPKRNKIVKIKPPKKPHSPFKLFVLEKAGSVSKEHSDELKETWKHMSDKKRAPWIRKCIEEENAYCEKVEQFKEEHPEIEVVPYKSVISKEEMKALERADGKPEDPPMSAFALFKKVMLQDDSIKDNFPAMPARMKEICRLWVEVSPDEKLAYTNQVNKMREEYLTQYQKYLESLPGDKKMAELAQGKLKKMHALEGFSPSGKKLKQISIMELLKPKKLKVESDNEDDEDEDLIVDKEEEINKIKQKIISNEPPSPPRNAFSLFRQAVAKDIPNEKAALAMWNKMKPSEKNRYEHKLAEVKQKYLLKYRSFLRTLSAEELSIYQQLKKSRSQSDEEDSDSDEEDSDDEEEKVTSAKSTNAVPVSKNVVQKSSSSEDSSEDSS